MLEETFLLRTVLTSFNKTTCLGVFVFVVDSYFANDYANEVQKAVYICTWDLFFMVISGRVAPAVLYFDVYKASS